MADQPFDLFYLPFRPALDANGIVVPGASLAFYISGTSTPQTIYADADLTIPLANPVTANAAGAWPAIYIDNALTYRVVLRNSLGAVLNEVDPYVPGAVGGPPGPKGEGLEDVMAPGGSSLVGFQQAGSAASGRTVESKLREGPISPDDFPLLANDTLKVQAALDARGLVQLSRSYTITAPLTVRGNTQIVGKPGSNLVWSGPPADCVLQDSSAAQKRAGQTAIDINLNILLENFEIVGGAYQAGGDYQVGIDFYRTGSVTIRGVTVHGIGGSGIRWGFSQTDCVDILVENCAVYDCRYGDAIQGVGRKIVVRNNTIGRLGSTTGNFGDTAIALLYDFEALSNPNGEYSSDVEVSGNTIIGNYTPDGTYVGNGRVIQTGMAFGPFKIGHRANLRITGNTVYGCYLNLWVIVMDDVLVAQNNFNTHGATATGNIRFDGVTGLRVIDNKIDRRLAGTGPDYSGIFLAAQRNQYGATILDADVARFEISGNTISSVQPGETGIRAAFETVNTSPSYVSKISSGLIEGNSFVNIATPVSLSPQMGTNPNVCNDVIIGRNKADSAAGRIVKADGNPAQFSNTRLRDNSAPVSIPPATGTGSSGLKWLHFSSGKVPGAQSGSAVNLMTLPVGNYTVLAAARVADQNSGAVSAFATIHVNGTGTRLTADNGSAMTITIDGLTVKATQSVGGPADIAFDFQYTL